MGNATVSAELKFEDTLRNTKLEFRYTETKTSNAGAGPRGISIYLKGTQNKKEYKINPNPHDNKAYIKSTAEFYKALANALVTHYFANADTFPGSLSVSWKSETYKLN